MIGFQGVSNFWFSVLFLESWPLSKYFQKTNFGRYGRIHENGPELNFSSTTSWFIMYATDFFWVLDFKLSCAWLKPNQKIHLHWVMMAVGAGNDGLICLGIKGRYKLNVPGYFVDVKTRVTIVGGDAQPWPIPVAQLVQQHPAKYLCALYNFFLLIQLKCRIFKTLSLLVICKWPDHTKEEEKSAIFHDVLL